MLQGRLLTRLVYIDNGTIPGRMEGCDHPRQLDFTRKLNFKGVWKRKNVDEGEYSFQYTNQQVQDIVQTVPLPEFIHAQYLRYIAHVCRQQNGSITKKLLFAKALKNYFRDPWL